MATHDMAELQKIGWLFREINAHFRDGIDSALRQQKVGLNFGQVSTLSILEASPGLNGAQLARRNMVTPQAMTGVLRQLALRRLVERRTHPESQRADSWHLTDRGSKALQRGRQAFATVTSRMIGDLAQPEVRRLQDSLRRCADALAAGRPT